MRNRGFTPTVIENALSIGEKTVQKNGNYQFFDSVNNLRVITNQQGKVITVIPGAK